ncbi:MAG: hypothetical protein HYV42_00305 [Candidatus Magasanikbacteria bacterium]|nr:hypothetical protein [Candidatus Magasanikbacteria bacterium]
MFRLSFEKKLLLIIAAFGLGSAAIISAVIIPTIRQIRQINRQTYELRLLLERQFNRTSQLRMSADQIRTVQEGTAAFARYRFQRGEALSLITGLEALSARHRLDHTIERSNLDQPDAPRLTFVLTTVGTLPDTLRYLSDLETYPKFLTIETLDWSARPSPGNSLAPPLVNMRLALALYVNQ